MRGRPAFAAADEQRRQVKAMAGYGVPQDDIAAVLTIDAKTLRKHFWVELQSGAMEANAKVAQSLFQRAVSEKGSAGVTAAIFWLKARAGWRDIAPATEGPIGKKEERAQAARTAAEGSPWAKLLQ
jgi:hypothetical protein